MIDPESKNPQELSTSAPTGLTSEGAGASPMQPDDLHDLFATPADFNSADDEDPLAQLRNDPNYSALIRDLEYIATQARLLFAPAEEAPSDEVWDKIQQGLKTKSEPAS